LIPTFAVAFAALSPVYRAFRADDTTKAAGWEDFASRLAEIPRDVAKWGAVATLPRFQTGFVARSGKTCPFYRHSAVK
jgi:hypothetical protein